MQNTQLVFGGTVTKLEELFEATKTNFKNLNEHLNISKTKLTRLLNNPREEGTIEIVRDISRLTKVAMVVLVNRLRIGASKITVDEMEILAKEDLSIERKQREKKTA